MVGVCVALSRLGGPPQSWDRVPCELARASLSPSHGPLKTQGGVFAQGLDVLGLDCQDSGQSE